MHVSLLIKSHLLTFYWPSKSHEEAQSQDHGHMVQEVHISEENANSLRYLLDTTPCRKHLLTLKV